MKTLKERAATALDYTHAIGERGPKTYMARQLLANWLDGAPTSKTKIEPACTWLEAIASAQAWHNELRIAP